MCVIAWAWHAHPACPLLVLANRDEFHARPAEPLHWWRSPAEFLAGRDVRAGGTWLGVTRSGRFAAVTNRAGPKPARAPSRGALPVAFLVGSADPAEGGAEVAGTADRYAGFNLLLSDGATLAFVSNREAQRRLAPGVHGMANDRLDESVPKVRRLVAALKRWAGAQEPLLAEDWLARLGDDSHEHGAGPESAIFVRGAAYGTRASSVVAIAADGQAVFLERGFDARGNAVRTERFQFEIVR